MSQVIDRRLNGKNKSAVNRQRFIRRFRGQIKKAVTDAVNKRSITDIDKGEKINIPSRDISEPTFRHAQGGKRQVVQPGNKEFITGDKVARPPQGGGEGGRGKASDSGEGMDDFVFELSREEFLEFFFDDLELPDLIKTQLATITEQKYHRAGYTTDGVPCNISIERSLRQALARRIALRAPNIARLQDVRVEMDVIPDDEENQEARAELLLEMENLERRINSIPFIDEIDLRYNHRVQRPEPSTQAVMFCVMDVSGSMDRERKDIAKRFFSLLYLFLQKNYEKIDVVFIRHHTIAKEVDEDDFFYSRETGGTVVSSALKMLDKVIHERYSSADWNIYVAQASDGDNWHGDSPLCRELLEEKIMPCLQYFAYVEINAEGHQRLWQEYERVAEHFNNFAMKQIDSAANIFPVFHDLFKKQMAFHNASQRHMALKRMASS